MKNPASLPAQAWQTKQTEDALQQVNSRTEGHGLALRPEEMRALVLRHQVILQDTGRIEFGESILPRLVFAFCDSPHIAPAAFAHTIDALLQCFYHFKNETMDRVGDEELLAFMKAHFDGDCQGSLEMLCGTRLEEFAHSLRQGQTPVGTSTENVADGGQSEGGDDGGA